LAKKEDIQITPAGRALYPKLNEPDNKFKAEGEYSVKLLLTEAEARPILEKCQELRQQAFVEEFERQCEARPKFNRDKIKAELKLADLGIKPYADPETGEETGDYVITFKMAASGVSKKTEKPWTRRPKLFDSANQPLDPAKVAIWSGSVLKVAYSLSPFYTGAVGAGASIRLEAVQVIKLVSGGGQDATDYGFATEEGGYARSAEDEDNDPNPAFKGFGGGEAGAGDGEPQGSEDF
jgi:hypothetical protein